MSAITTPSAATRAAASKTRRRPTTWSAASSSARSTGCGAPILQNVVVADVKRPEKLDQIGAVELLLNPNEAQYAALSLEQGSLHLARRASGDAEMHPMEMATFRKLFK